MHQIAIITAGIVGMVIIAEQMKIRLPQRRFQQWIWLIFAVYVAGNLYCTLLSRTPGSGTILQLKPGQSITRLFSEPVTAGTEVTGLMAWFMRDSGPIAGMILNVLLYVPMGYLLHVLFPKMKRWQIIFIGCLCSVATETCQYFIKTGWCETDDVIYNTLGTVIGAWVWQMQSRRLRKRAE